MKKRKENEKKEECVRERERLMTADGCQVANTPAPALWYFASPGRRFDGAQGPCF